MCVCNTCFARQVPRQVVTNALQLEALLFEQPLHRVAADVLNTCEFHWAEPRRGNSAVKGGGIPEGVQKPCTDCTGSQRSFPSRWARTKQASPGGRAVT